MASSKETTIEIIYDQQFLAKPRTKVWESAMEYPADRFSLEEVVSDTKDQRKLSEKPLRVVKVTVTTEVVEVFK